MRDLRCARAFLCEASLALTGQRTARPPAGRVVVGPLGQIEVEGPHRGEHAAPVQPRPADLAPDLGDLRAGEHALLPGRGDVAGQLQRVDAGVVGLQIGPKQLAEQVGQVLQGGEVHRRLAFAQVVDQHVAHLATRDAVAVDQLLAVGLTTAEEHFDRVGRVRAEVAVRAQQLIKQRAFGVAVVGGTGARGGGEQFEAVADPYRRDVPPLTAMTIATLISACCWLAVRFGPDTAR